MSNRLFPDLECLGNGFLTIRVGHINSIVVGGPYLDKPTHYLGIKMAKEIEAPCQVNIPTADFSVPDVKQLRRGLLQALALMAQDKDLYVGCMGGIGRTGLFLAALAKVMKAGGHLRDRDPIEYVREEYLSTALETREQQHFINTLFVDDIASVAKFF